MNTGFFWSEESLTDLLALEKDEFLSKYPKVSAEAYRQRLAREQKQIEDKIPIEITGDGNLEVEEWNYKPRRPTVPFGVEKHVMIGDTHGVFVDQKWCNLIPCFFDDVKTLRDPGFNVASWNLSSREVRITDTGEIRVNGEPLRFFHFTKLGPVGDTMTRRYAGGNTDVYELWWWYRQEVEKYTDPAIPEGWWHYGVFADGRQELITAFLAPGVAVVPPLPNLCITRCQGRAQSRFFIVVEVTNPFVIVILDLLDLRHWMLSQQFPIDGPRQCSPDRVQIAIRGSDRNIFKPLDLPVVEGLGIEVGQCLVQQFRE